MDRQEAARILGIAEDASEDDIQDAFRSRVRSNHPDLVEFGAVDISTLTWARDVLLGNNSDNNGSAPAPSNKTGPPGSQKSVFGKAMSDARSKSVRRTESSGNFVANVKKALMVLVALAVLYLAVTWLLGRGGDDDLPVPESIGARGDCLVLVVGEVTPANCRNDDALRIEAIFTGARSCAAGQQALEVESATWCVVPAN